MKIYVVGCSLESSLRDDSNELPQHMFVCRNKKIDLKIFEHQESLPALTTAQSYDVISSINRCTYKQMQAKCVRIEVRTWAGFICRFAKVLPKWFVLT